MKLNEWKDLLKKEFPNRQEGNFTGFLERTRLDNIQIEDLVPLINPDIKKEMRKSEAKLKRIANTNGTVYFRRDKYLTLAGVAVFILNKFIDRGYK